MGLTSSPSSSTQVEQPPSPPRRRACAVAALHLAIHLGTQREEHRPPLALLVCPPHPLPWRSTGGLRAGRGRQAEVRRYCRVVVGAHMLYKDFPTTMVEKLIWVMLV